MSRRMWKLESVVNYVFFLGLPGGISLLHLGLSIQLGRA